jgi:hypothetical protein
MIAGAQPSDVRVVETHRPNRPAGDDDNVHVQLARGPVAVQIYGTLRELQVVMAEVVNQLVEIGRVRGLEGR